MQADDIKRAILDQIGEQWDRTNLHAVNLRRCLVDPPRLRTYLDGFHANTPIELWLVLEEDPVTHVGYEIVFDEEKGFGLAATQRHETPVLVGWYDTFLDAFEGM